MYIVLLLYIVLYQINSQTKKEGKIMKSKTHIKAIKIAFNMENLQPFDCIEILERLYGERMEYMKPKTIFNMVNDMMQTQTNTENIHSDIIEAVNNYIHS